MSNSSDDASWIERIADATERRQGRSLLKRAEVTYVERYEASLEYLGAIATALKNGKPVSVWEFLDAAVMATNEDHPNANDAVVAFQQMHKGNITQEQCSIEVSKSWAEIAARYDAVCSVKDHLAAEIGSLEGLAVANKVTLDKSKKFADWRKFTPIRR